MKPDHFGLARGIVMAINRITNVRPKLLDILTLREDRFTQRFGVVSAFNIFLDQKNYLVHQYLDYSLLNTEKMSLFGSALLILYSYSANSSTIAVIPCGS